MNKRPTRHWQRWRYIMIASTIAVTIGVLFGGWVGEANATTLIAMAVAIPIVEVISLYIVWKIFEDQACSNGWEW